jgi:hypothetical protein
VGTKTEINFKLTNLTGAEMTELEKVLKEVIERRADDLWEIQLTDKNIDEIVEDLLTPDKEGYAWEWAEIVEDVVNEVTGQQVRCWPLAESWDILFTEGDKFLGTAVIDTGAPYLDFKTLLAGVKKAVEEIKERLPQEEKKERDNKKTEETLRELKSSFRRL